MIFRQSGAGVGAQALSFKVWWCVPCWSGGREPWQVQDSVCLRVFLVSWKYSTFPWLNHQLSRVLSLHLGSSASRWMTWNGVSASLPASPLAWKNFPPCLLLRKHSPHATPTFRIHEAMLSMILGQMNQSDQRTDLSKDSSWSRMHWTKNTSTTSLPADCHLAVTGGHLDTMRCEFHGLL